MLGRLQAEPQARYAERFIEALSRRDKTFWESLDRHKRALVYACTATTPIMLCLKQIESLETGESILLVAMDSSQSETMLRLKSHEIIEISYEPPSQEWLDDALDWLEQNPISDRTPEIIDNLLSARNAKKRLDRIRAFIHQHNSLDNVSRLIGIDSSASVRTSIDNWLSVKKNNIAQWLIRSRGEMTSLLVNEADLELGTNWLVKHLNHAYTAPVILALLHHDGSAERVRMALDWAERRTDNERSAQVIASLLVYNPSPKSIALANEYIKHNPAHNFSQKLMALMIQYGHSKDYDALLKTWLSLPVRQRSGELLAALLTVAPQNKRLNNLAREFIRTQPFPSEVEDVILKGKCSTGLQKWYRDRILENAQKITSPKRKNFVDMEIDVMCSIYSIWLLLAKMQI